MRSKALVSSAQLADAASRAFDLLEPLLACYDEEDLSRHAKDELALNCSVELSGV